MYVIMCMQPNFANCQFGKRYANNLSKGHWQVMKWILQYIMQTLNVSLVFQQDDDIGQCVVSHVKSNYTTDFKKYQIDDSLCINLLLLQDK